MTTNYSPKYLNSIGMQKSGGFFNLSGVTGDKDLIVVEGELDSLHATVKGIKNVVATGGNSISREQVENSIRLGAKSFTLSFDNDGEEKKADTHKRIIAAIKTIRSVDPNIKIYVVSLPSSGGQKVDPDSFIREHGADAFQNLLDNAVPDWEYRLRILFDDKVETPKEQDRLIISALKISSSLPDPIDKERFSNQFISAAQAFGLNLGIKSLEEKMDLLAQARMKEEKDKKLKSTMDEAFMLHGKGETEKALEFIKENIVVLQAEEDATDYSKLLLPLSEEALIAELSRRPESLDTGYLINGEPLLIPPGALIFIVAPTSHGKTTFALNLQLKISLRYPAVSTIFISLEESHISIIIKSLNIYIGKKLSNNNKASLYSYFKGNSEYIASDSMQDFTKTKEMYFEELLKQGRIHIKYSDADIEVILEILSYIIKYSKLPVGAVFIDYIQLLNLSSERHKFNSRQEQLKKICLILKDFAVETQLPIVLGAQFNREVVNLLAMDPTRIGEAGDIERIANLVIGMWNTNFEGIATPQEKNEIKKIIGGYRDVIFVKVLKNRDGRVGHFGLLHFEGNTGRISNMSLDTGADPKL